MARDGIRASGAHGAHVAPTEAGQQTAGILTRRAQLLGEERKAQQGCETQGSEKN